MIALLRPGAGKNPAAAGGGAVVLELGEAVQLLAFLQDDLGLVLGIGQVGQSLAVILHRQFLGRRREGNLVVPGKVQDRVGKGAALLPVQLPQLKENAGDDVGIGLGIPRRVGALVVPLQPSPAVGEGAVLLGEAGGGETDDFGLDLGRGPRRCIRRGSPRSTRFPWPGGRSPPDT